ncbi:protein phosphatase 2C domain-containing protein [uncultured Selenomonas sp.]|uniref:PP2C family serine/threonine-protein phosphatase n=1 Tax=uncultured Selenomonas sp. TaxID=159275 RepID=UPI0028EB4A66|nr:protein phosphatase 2C domain-containing protein [uncultured Selenomonas sp.]
MTENEASAEVELGKVRLEKHAAAAPPEPREELPEASVTPPKTVKEPTTPEPVEKPTAPEPMGEPPASSDVLPEPMGTTPEPIAEQAELPNQPSEWIAIPFAPDSEPPAPGDAPSKPTSEPPTSSAAAAAASADAVAEPDDADDAPAALSDEAVLAHTASLWQYHPIPQDEPDAAPEYKTEEKRIGTAEFVAARVRGKKHKHEATNCDDWFAVAAVGDIAVLAVSDGAGSKRFSRVGARAASEAAVGSIYERLRTLDAASAKNRAAFALPMEEAAFGEACARLGAALHAGVLDARRAVLAAFHERCGQEAYTKLLGRDLALSDFAATLLVTVAVPVPDLGEVLVLSCQVGDGITCAIDTHAPYGKAVKLLGKPDSGDFSGETDFLTSEAMADITSLQRRTLVTRGAYDLILTMTDGVADDYFNEQEMHRLYLDLVANGIVPGAQGAATFTRTEVELLRSLPQPAAFPWVNDKEQHIALQYASHICRKIPTTEECLWQNAHVLALAAEDTSLKGVASHAERLKIWLDNYVTRASFDDRTLALLAWKEPPHV